jgi:hypothetical protein
MGKSSGQQTTTQKVELPQWVQDAGQKNLAAAYQVSGNMMGPYSGQRVAGMTSGAQNDINAIQNNVGSTNPAFAYAQGAAGNLTNYQPGQVNAGSLAGTDLSSYMNPYTQNVINSGLQSLDVQRQQALNGIGDQAIKTGAFGGSRQGISEGITNAASSMQAGQLASNLMNQNFMQAQGAATNDINRNFQGQLANQQAGLQGAGLNLSAANSLGNLAAQGQNSFLQGTGAALAGQGAIQQQNQGQLDAQHQYYNEQQQFPLQQLQIPLQALGMTPYGSTTTSSTPTSGNSFLSGIGALLGGFGSLAPFFGASDEQMKTDVQKMGKDPVSGLDLYAYRYKGDPKSYPKVVGPMAQDIEKKYPDQVVDVGGRKAVNLGFGPMAKAFK